MRLHMRYGGNKRATVTNVHDTSREEILHEALAKAFQANGKREVLAFVEEPDGMVQLIALSFFNDPDNDPYYGLRLINATRVTTTSGWRDDQFQDAITEAIGNFEPRPVKQAQEDDKIRPEVRALAARGKVTLAEWEAFRGNSWEMELLLPQLDDQAFAFATNHMVQNSMIRESRPYVTYPDALIGLMIPELLRRLKERPPVVEVENAMLEVARQRILKKRDALIGRPNAAGRRGGLEEAASLLQTMKRPS